MRTRRAAPAALREGPVRTCTGCRARRPKEDLIRVVRGPDGVVRLAEPAGSSGRSAKSGGLDGRGAYACPDERCIRRAFDSGRLRRVLRVEGEGLPGSLLGRMLQELEGPPRRDSLK
ncbi:MAG TPA: YlxR family protein [Actinomycetota bacterium]|nr:YlxR family protein [Actinomycetota bacterium]